MFAFRSHSRRLRQTVWVTLLAWLFGLTAAVVNACMLSGPRVANPGLIAALHPAHSAKAFAGTEHHEPSLASHPLHEPSNAHDNCLKFCDDESSALSKGRMSAIDLGAALVAAVDLPGAARSDHECRN